MFATFVTRARRLAGTVLDATVTGLRGATALSFETPAISLADIESDLSEGTA